MARRILFASFLLGAALLFALLVTSQAQASDCTVEAFSVSPSSSSQAVGTILSLYGRGNCAGGIRASRFNIDGGGFGEDAGAPEQSETWQLTAGFHTICFEIAGGSNGDWPAGARSCTTITGTIANPPNSPTCIIEFFNATPSSPIVLGTEVTLHGRGNCGTSRFEINGQPRAEIGAPEQTETWRTAEFGVGTYNVCYVLRGDGGWENADRECKTYVVASTVQPPPTTPPSICEVTSFSVSPGGGTLGTIFTFSGSGVCNRSVRAVRFLIDGSPFGETSGSAQIVTWNSSGYAEGSHMIGFQVTADSWEQAASSYVSISLANNSESPEIVHGEPSNNISDDDGYNDPYIPISGELVDDQLWHGSLSPLDGNYVQVNAYGLRIRRDANSDADILGFVVNGEYYSLLATRGDWGKITTSRGEGWVSLSFTTTYYESFELVQDIRISEQSNGDLNYYTLEGCLIGKTSFQAIQSAIFSTSHTIQSIFGCQSFMIDVSTVAYPECQLQLNVWFIETQTGKVIRLARQFNNVTCNPDSQHGTIIDFGTNWCSVTPFEIGNYGIDTGHFPPTPRYEMYLPPSHVNFDLLPSDAYFIYFNDSYVGPDVSSKTGWSSEMNGWLFGIDTTWALSNPNWRNPALWRVDYKCH